MSALSGAHGFEALGCGCCDGAQCEAAAFPLVDSAACVVVGACSLRGGFEGSDLSRATSLLVCGGHEPLPLLLEGGVLLVFLVCFVVWRCFAVCFGCVLLLNSY